MLKHVCVHLSILQPVNSKLSRDFVVDMPQPSRFDFRTGLELSFIRFSFNDDFLREIKKASNELALLLLIVELLVT